MTTSLQRYVDQRIPSRLREVFVEMMDTPTGRRLAESSAQRRARYILDPTGKLGWGSMTVNLFRLVLIGRDTLQNRPALINSLAHEASHIEQKYISDSFEQEYEAFVTAAQVMTGLGLPDSFGWDAPELQSLSPEQAARKIMEMFPDHPLYGMNPAIPVYQVRGLRGFIEPAKQAWTLLRAA
jgi:hypothetical protein